MEALGQFQTLTVLLRDAILKAGDVSIGHDLSVRIEYDLSLFSVDL